MPNLTPDMLVWAYSRGIFPMASSRGGEVSWYSADPRGVLPLEEGGAGGFRVPRSLRRRVARGDFHVTRDRAFGRVIRACAEPRSYAEETWINEEIIEVYVALHTAGLAHSVEAWRDERCAELLGGLYGVTLGGAYFGESMFSRATDASKVCLVHLVEHLQRQGFSLLDTQFKTEHLAQFGVIEIPRAEYLKRLERALRLQVGW